MGKKLAEEKKKAQGKSTETSSGNVSTPITAETEIKIKSVKGENIIIGKKMKFIWGLI